MGTWLGHLRNRGLPCRLAALAGTLVVALSITVPVAMHLGGFPALAAAALAAGLCGAGAATALVVGDRLRGPSGVLTALGIGIVARTGVPLAVVVALHLRGGLLAQAGLLWYFVVFYPITLIAATLLSLPATRQPAPLPHRPSKTPTS
jgi:hypothetical protein